MVDVRTALDWTTRIASLFGSQPRLRVWNLTEHFWDGPHHELHQLGGQLTPDTIRFEVENLGRETSLQPTVVLKGYLPAPRSNRKGAITYRRCRFEFLIVSADRHLAPHTPLRLEAIRPTEDTYGAPIPSYERETEHLGRLWFKVYTFKPTRGRPIRVRVRSADGVRLGWWRFSGERLRLLLTNQVAVAPRGSLRR